MKHTLLLRLQAPMQAWGVQSHFVVRDSAREPTKSGVTGLLAAALGRSRDAPLEDLAALRMGVRVDREGRLMVDFHSAQKVVNAAGKVLRNAVISNRYYLADAVFLVGLETENIELLQQIQYALQRPKWLLFLGRRAFPPAVPLWFPNGLHESRGLIHALENFPWLIAVPKSEYQRRLLPEKLRMIVEDQGGPMMRMDLPTSFAERTFTANRFLVRYCQKPTEFYQEGGQACS